MIGVCNMERIAGNMFKAMVYRSDIDKKFSRTDVVFFDEFTARDHGNKQVSLNVATGRDEEIMDIDDRYLMNEDEASVYLSEVGYPDEY